MYLSWSGRFMSILEMIRGKGYCCDGYYCDTALLGLLEGGNVLCVIGMMLRSIYCYVLMQSVGEIGMHIAEGRVKHQLPIVAVITIRAAAAG